MRVASRGLGIASVLGAFAAGSAAMYALDPDHGRRRRGRMRDVAKHLECEARDLIGKGTRDMRQRTRGAFASLGQSFRHDEAGDDVVEERVRSEVGRSASHPHAIEVHARNGVVSLKGFILVREAETLCARVARVRGVRGVDSSQLERHTSAENIPSLQGEGRIPALARGKRWTPARRLAGGAAGAALFAAGLGLGRRGAGRALMLAGGALVARAALGPRGRQGLQLQKTLYVDAPVDQVYAFFSNFENFPRFMQHVRHVKRTGEPAGWGSSTDARRWGWVLEGPAGIPLHWEAMVTRQVPNEIFAWRTTGASTVAHAGTVRFEKSGGGTRLEMLVSYRPLGGALGRAVAMLLGADPKRALDEDMLRFKSLLERGKTTVRGHEVSREQVLS